MEQKVNLELKEITLDTNILIKRGIKGLAFFQLECEIINDIMIPIS
jgi:DUF2075 family protein